MNPEIVTGLFVLLGAAVGGAASYFSATIGHDRSKAQREIVRLCEQVEAYYRLEQLYKDELATLDPARRSPKTVMQEMRDRVEQIDGYKRPTMTDNAARRIREYWS